MMWNSGTVSLEPWKGKVCKSPALSCGLGAVVLTEKAGDGAGGGRVEDYRIFIGMMRMNMVRDVYMEQLRLSGLETKRES